MHRRVQLGSGLRVLRTTAPIPMCACLLMPDDENFDRGMASGWRNVRVSTVITPKLKQSTFSSYFAYARPMCNSILGI